MSLNRDNGILLLNWHERVQLLYPSISTNFSMAKSIEKKEKREGERNEKKNYKFIHQLFVLISSNIGSLSTTNCIKKKGWLVLNYDLFESIAMAFDLSNYINQYFKFLFINFIIIDGEVGVKKIDWVLPTPLPFIYKQFKLEQAIPIDHWRA